MLLKALPYFAALGSVVRAAPTLPSVEARDNITALRLASRAADPPGGPITCGGAPPCVTAPPTGETCIFNFQVSGGFAHGWAVGVPGDTLSNYGEGSSTLGGGLLDNLRGQCGVISDWEAEADDDDNLAARFSTTIFCGSDDVHNAIWLANGKNYEANCEYSDSSWDSLNWSSGVTTGLQVLFDAIGVLLPRT